MAGVVPQHPPVAESAEAAEPVEPDEPVSPELAMIDPELASRSSLMPAVWETVRIAQQAARETGEPPHTDPETTPRRRPWLVVLALAAIAGGVALALAALGAFSNQASSPTTAPKRAAAPATRKHAAKSATCYQATPTAG